MATTADSTTPRPADVFVVFGITGDLARVMTFRSLYRLEAPRPPRLPDRRRRRRRLDARPARRAGPRLDRGHRRARSTRRSSSGSPTRLSYVSGDFTDPATYERVGDAIKGAETPVFYLEIPPFLFGKVVKGLADAGLSQGARFVIEKPFGHDQQSARDLADELHEYVDESQLFRIDHYLGKMGLEEILHLRFANAILEPIWSRNYLECVQITMAEDFGVDDRGQLLRPGRRAARRRGQPPDAGRRGRRDGAARRAATRPPSRSRRSRCSARSPRPTRPTTSAASTTATRTSTGVAAGLDHRDVRRAAARHRELALGRRAVLHPHRQAAAGHPDRAAPGLQAPAAAGLLAGRPPPRAEPARHQARPVHRDPLPGRRPPCGPRADRTDRARHGVRRRGRRGRRRRTRSCCTRR